MRYHHLIDPDRGEPARGCRSVTIVADRAVLADVLSTGVFIMGPDEGMALIERLPDVEGVIVTATNEVLISSGLKDRVEIRGETHGGAIAEVRLLTSMSRIAFGFIRPRHELHTKILLGLAVGLVLGATVNLTIGAGHPAVEAVNTYLAVPLGQIFLRMLFMVVMPLVFASIALGVRRPRRHPQGRARRRQGDRAISSSRPRWPPRSD